MFVEGVKDYLFNERFVVLGRRLTALQRGERDKEKGEERFRCERGSGFKEKEIGGREFILYEPLFSLCLRGEETNRNTEFTEDHGGHEFFLRNAKPAKVPQSTLRGFNRSSEVAEPQGVH